MSQRRFVRIAVLVGVALAVIAGGHFYLAQRLILDPEWSQPLSQFLIGGLSLLAFLLFLEPFAQRRLPLAWQRWVAWPAFVWLGLGFFLSMLLILSEGVLWLSAAAVDSSAELLLAARLRAIVIFGTALALGVVALRAGLRAPPLQRIEITLPRWPHARDGYRIVQISDLHIGALLGRRFVEKLVERINVLKPDLIAITGDLVDGSVARLGREVSPLASLRARDGVYFITGNHDYYSGARSWVAYLRELGLRVLRNERVGVGHGEAAFDIAGVDDHLGSLVTRGEGEDLDKALADRDPERPVVLLAHDPSSFVRAQRFGVDLQLSGHTHGGQIWPFGYLVRRLIPYLAGLYREGASQLYVSRGTGFWGPPMRLLCPSEISELVLRSQEATARS